MISAYYSANISIHANRSTIPHAPPAVKYCIFLFLQCMYKKQMYRIEYNLYRCSDSFFILFTI